MRITPKRGAGNHYLGVLAARGRQVKAPSGTRPPAVSALAIACYGAVRPNRSAMRLVLIFARAYPARGALMLVCLVLAGLAEGVGMSSILPLINLAAAGSSAGPPGSVGSDLAQAITAALRSAGAEPTPAVLLALVTGGILFKALLVLVATKQVGFTVAHFATDLRLELIRALLRSRWQYYVHQPLGTLLGAVASETRRAGAAYLHATSIVAMLLQALAYVVVGLLISWPATLVALLATVVVVALLTGFVRSARRAGVRQTEVMQSLLKRLTDLLQSVKPLKAMGREALLAPTLGGETRRLQRALRREVLSTEAVEALQEPMAVTVFAIGLYLAQTQLDVPIASVIVLAVVGMRIVASLGRVQKEYQRMVVSESAYWAVRGLIDRVEGQREPAAGEAAPTLRQAIEVRDVRVAYDGAPAIDGASMRLPAGQLTAVIGPSGAGKTTLADVVIGLLQPTAGTVLVDGVPLAALDQKRWRAGIGCVPQETFLLHDSIARNVTLGDPELSPADAETALRQAGAWDFVAALPDGTATLVGERGLRLSGGQRQRLALARALVRQPALLVLDEATAALDPATEADVCRTLQALRGQVTMLAVCHQGPLIDAADNVYRISDGTVAAVRVGRPSATPVC